MKAGDTSVPDEAGVITSYTKHQCIAFMTEVAKNVCAGTIETTGKLYTHLNEVLAKNKMKVGRKLKPNIQYKQKRLRTNESTDS